MVLLLSFIVTFFLIPLFCWVSRRYKLVDVPDGIIKTHKQPVPNLGGLAVYIGFICACLLYGITGEKSIFSVISGSTLFLVIGLIDDRICFKPHQKFLCQCIGAAIFLKMGLYAQPFSYAAINISLSFLWILTIANAFNLIDIMDGLATTVAIGITLTLLAIAFYTKTTMLVLTLLALAGALFAFLYYNKPAARIYLGDAGALFIGGFLGVIPFLISWDISNPYGYLIPCAIFAIPLYEVFSLIIIRTYKKIPFYLPSEDHFCLCLIRKGWSKKNILWYISAVSAYIGCITFLFVIRAISFVEFSIISIPLLCIWMHFLTTRTAKFLRISL